jgi:hypothetical protein
VTPIHPSGIDPDVAAKVVARRGRLHALETLDPHRTALVVINHRVGRTGRQLPGGDRPGEGRGRRASGRGWHRRLLRGIPQGQ